MICGFTERRFLIHSGYISCILLRHLFFDRNKVKAGTRIRCIRTEMVCNIIQPNLHWMNQILIPASVSSSILTDGFFLKFIFSCTILPAFLASFLVANGFLPSMAGM